MKSLIREIKELTMALYGAEISKRDVELFLTLGKEKCKKIKETLKRALDEEHSLLISN